MTTNQTLIVAIGKSINPINNVTPLSDDGLDPQHAAPGSPCFGCHQFLDPMRLYFRSNYSLNYDAQLDPTQIQQTGSFAYDGVSSSGTSMDDFANTLANHRDFAPAWVQKLCYYANSAGLDNQPACLPSDPEFQRIASDFTKSHYDFSALSLASSSPYFASRHRGRADRIVDSQWRAPIHRSLPAPLQATPNRLDLAVRPAGAGGLPQIEASSVPPDGYSRGNEVPILATQPSVFLRASTEALCESLANTVIDTGSSRYVSTDPGSAIEDFVSNLMGLPASDPAAPAVLALLQSHYQAAVSAQNKPQDALKSTFVVACTSPLTTTVGL